MWNAVSTARRTVVTLKVPALAARRSSCQGWSELVIDTFPPSMDWHASRTTSASVVLTCVRVTAAAGVVMSGLSQGVAGGLAVRLPVGDAEPGQAVEAPAGGDAGDGFPVAGLRGLEVVVGAVEPGAAGVTHR
jgi:hypothetical protein